MKVLVTGGAGFIGSTLVGELMEQKYDVSIVDNLSTGRLENINANAALYQGDIMHSYFDNEKAKKGLNWNPQYSLEQGLSEMFGVRRIERKNKHYRTSI